MLERIKLCLVTRGFTGENGQSARKGTVCNQLQLWFSPCLHGSWGGGEFFNRGLLGHKAPWIVSVRWIRVVSQNVTLPVDSAFPSAPQVRRGNDEDEGK